jgi:hypothetical protein
MFSVPPTVPAARQPMPICDIETLARSPTSTSLASSHLAVASALPSPAALASSPSLVSAMPSPADEPGGVSDLVAAMRKKLGGEPATAGEPVAVVAVEKHDGEELHAEEEEAEMKATMKRPAAAASSVLKRPTAAMKRPAAATDFGLVLGCGKCRRSVIGCAQCRDPKFGGRRGR